MVNGGVLNFIELENISIKDSLFFNNSATQNGGVIYGREISDEIEILNCNFTFNKADQDGGVIYIQQIENIIIKNTVVTSNYAASSGGFLYADTIL